MNERDSLLASIADTIKDYRKSEIPEPTPDHVNRWVSQFGTDVQVPLLRELDHVFKQTYFSKKEVEDFFSYQINNKKLVGENPHDFWQAAHILNIQGNGNSQKEIRKLFGEALAKELKLKIDKCGSTSGAFIYLDDVLFSGTRVNTDLMNWLEKEASKKGVCHILVMAAHRLGEWQCLKSLKEAASKASKELEIHCWAAKRIENRKSYRNQSEVLWPAEIPDDKDLQAYIEGEKKFPFTPRALGGKLENAIFSSEDGRKLLEREMLLAGMRIRSFSQSPSRALRPLGFSAFGLGFGSMIVTYRNCPNNTPLALWWGDPEAPSNHPFSRWYPLLPRKTYNEEVDLDDFPF
ncbi:MAG: hypothetical protein WAP08_12505 [Smithellaceae bacterium]